jgi:hypothetical protein
VTSWETFFWIKQEKASSAVEVLDQDMIGEGAKRDEANPGTGDDDM